LAHDYKLRLIGGDVSAAPGGLFVGITVVGEIEKGQAVVRSGAKGGDLIFVTGTLGDSAAGLALAKTLGRADQRDTSFVISTLLPLLQRQFYPMPRIHEGRLFSTRRIASAMIDLSDGLASDLRHVCEESGVGAVVDAAALPLSPALVEYARQVRRDPLGYALTGGEDFELLLTVPDRRVAHLMKLVRQKRIKVSQIGRVFPRASGIRLKGAGGKMLPFPRRGYEHFA
jgi:thiamine-monophosphate kinase